MSTKEETKTLSLWQRFKKTALTIAVVVSLMWSFTNQHTLEQFKDSIGPIGTNPPQYTPSKFMVAELGTEHLHPPVNWLTDTIIGHNDGSNMLSKLGTVNDIRSGLATTASLSGYVPTSRTITINGTAFDLSANRSWTIPGTTYSAGSGLSLTGTTFANTAPDQVVSLTAGTNMGLTGSYPTWTINNTYLPTINTSPGRALNTNWTTGSRPGVGFYTITCSVTNPLIAGSSTANAYLEYSTNGGSSWQPVLAQGGNSSTVGVAVAIAITNGQVGQIIAPLVANATYRIRTATTGTASLTLTAQCELNL